MRAAAAGLTVLLLPGLAVPAGLPWPAACFLGLLGMLGTTGPAVLREMHLHREVMAAFGKACDQNDLDVTEVITLVRGVPVGSWSRRSSGGK